MSGSHGYEWDGDWAKLPESGGWAHHGVVVLRSGEVVAFAAGESRFVVLGADGSVVRTFEAPVLEAHGVSVVEEDGVEYLWVADCGVKMVPAPEAEIGWSMQSADGGGQVVKLRASGPEAGSVVQRLPLPPAGLPYAPTWVVVNDDNGDIWVADGYAQSLVHRFAASGEWLATFDGGEARFNCPHALFLDRRSGAPLLYVADRGNARVQVLDMSGATVRVFGSEFLLSPSVFAAHGEYLIIGELNARVTVLDGTDSLVAYVGSNTEVCSVDGWPNSRDADGKLVRQRLLEHGKFNSPHGLAVDPAGNVYVSEWLIGGRFTKLAHASSAQ